MPLSMDEARKQDSPAQQAWQGPAKGSSKVVHITRVGKPFLDLSALIEDERVKRVGMCAISGGRGCVTATATLPLGYAAHSSLPWQLIKKLVAVHNAMARQRALEGQPDDWICSMRLPALQGSDHSFTTVTPQLRTGILYQRMPACALCNLAEQAVLTGMQGCQMCRLKLLMMCITMISHAGSGLRLRRLCKYVMTKYAIHLGADKITSPC